MQENEFNLIIDKKIKKVIKKSVKVSKIFNCTTYLTGYARRKNNF